MSASLWGQTFESLHSFPTSGEDGSNPQTALTLASDGNFYGVTSAGGANGVGTLFKYSITEGFSVVHDFDPATTGAMFITRPTGQLVNIGDGYLYGTTFAGGTPPSGAGTVYRLDPATGNITVLYAISSAGTTTPQDGVALVSGEANVLHALCSDYSGIWRIPLDGSDPTVSFFTSDGRKPTSIIRGSDGFLYGGTESGGTTQHGSIFRANPDGSEWTVIHNCTPETGNIPHSSLLEIDGNFYGVMGYGGPEEVKSVNGVFYRLSPAGEYTILRAFGDFDVPSGDLVRASDGMIYGVARQVGPGGNGNGGIYRIKTDGSGYRVLHVFDTNKKGIEYPTGRTPVGGLVQGPDGHLYGTTQGGPQNSGGGIFRLKLNLPPPPINLPPIAVNDVGVLNGANVTVNVLANDFNPDNDALRVDIEEDPSFGTVDVQQDGSIIYTPEAGEFDGDSFSYKVSDLRGGVSVATVTIQTTLAGPLVLAGSYNGLLYLDETLTGGGELPRGQYLLTVGENGRFTGTLLSQNKRASFRGEFDENGTATADVAIPGDGKGHLFLTFHRGEPNFVQAFVLGSQFWSGNAGPTRVSDFETDRKYTVQVVSNADALLPGILPKGHGYGTVTIKPSGAVSMVGKLGDGSNFKWGSSLVRFPDSPILIPMYSVPLKGGVCAGFVAADGDNRFEGSVQWVRPASKPNKPYALGFSGAAEIWFAPFTPPAKDEAVIQLGDGIVSVQPPDAPTVAGQFTIEGKKITRAGELRSLTINRSNGLYSGTVRDEETRKTYSFKGAIDQGERFGLGQVSVKGETGSVQLSAPLAD